MRVIEAKSIGLLADASYESSKLFELARAYFKSSSRYLAYDNSPRTHVLYNRDRYIHDNCFVSTRVARTTAIRIGRPMREPFRQIGQRTVVDRDLQCWVWDKSRDEVAVDLGSNLDRERGRL